MATIKKVVAKKQYGGASSGKFMKIEGELLKKQGQANRKAGLTKKADGMGLFNVSELKTKPLDKNLTGAQLKTKGEAIKAKGVALKAKGQSMSTKKMGGATKKKC